MVLKSVRSALVGRYVKLKKGRLYKGRKALVDSVILSPEGEFLVLAYVLLLKPYPRRKFLNCKSESRQYWRIDELEWLE